MPELPEVQTIVSELKQAGIVGRMIEHIEVYWPKTVAQPTLAVFIKRLLHQTILDIYRRGKYLIFSLSDGSALLVHLRMTGRLLLTSADQPLPPYVRLILDLDHHRQLRFHDTRKFGRWYLVNHPDDILHKIGPEPLDADFQLKTFKTRLKNKKRALKPLLLDQTFLAGLGNIYVDEALWEAQLHPLQTAHTLTDQQVKKLYHAIILVLKRGIESQGTTLGKGKTNFYRLDGNQGQHQTRLQVFRRTGEPCNRCGHLIERLVVAQRGTHICPNCQFL